MFRIRVSVMLWSSSKTLFSKFINFAFIFFRNYIKLVLIPTFRLFYDSRFDSDHFDTQKFAFEQPTILDFFFCIGSILSALTSYSDFSISNNESYLCVFDF